MSLEIHGSVLLHIRLGPSNTISNNRFQCKLMSVYSETLFFLFNICIFFSITSYYFFSVMKIIYASSRGLIK